MEKKEIKPFKVDKFMTNAPTKYFVRDIDPEFDNSKEL